MATLDPYPRPDDAFNPYASPKSALGRPEFAYGAGAASSLPFGVGAVFGRTWEIFKAEWALCIGTVFACGAMNTIAPYIPLLLLTLVGGTTTVVARPGGGGPAPMPGPGNPAEVQAMLMVGAVAVVLGIATLIFAIWIGVGQTLVLLNVARGRQASFGDVFRGGPYILRMLLAAILFGIVAGVGFAVLAGISGGLASVVDGDDRSVVGPVFGVGMLVASIITIFASIRFSQFHYLIIERGVGALESLRMSVQATRGRVSGLIGLYLLASLANLGGFLACGVGLLATIPFTMLMFAVAYLSLVGGPVADPAGRGKPYVSGDPLAEF